MSNRPRIAALVFAANALIPGSAMAQEFIRAAQFGSPANDVAEGVAVDLSGNVYTVGYFSGTADFDPGPEVYALTAAGGQDVFVSVVDSAGEFVWAARLGGPDYASAQDVAVDTNGNVCIVGRFTGTVDFDPGPGTFALSSSNEAAFISVLDSAGNFVWAAGLSGNGTVRAYGVAADPSGNVYAVGTFWGTADFDPGPGTFNLSAGSPAGYPDAFVAVLSSTGDFVWAADMGGFTGDEALDVALDAGGNVYTVGDFAGTADFDPGPGTANLSSAAGTRDVFVSVLDPTGDFVRAQRLGGTGTDLANGVAVDSAGNVYTVGRFEDTVDFDPGPGTANLVSAGRRDAFLLVLDSAGDLVWARSSGGTWYDEALDVVVDASGNVYTSGAFQDTADFDPGPNTFSLTSEGGNEAFVWVLDSAGSFVWAGQFGGAGHDFARGLAVDPDGYLHTVGTFFGTADFDPGPDTFDLTAVGEFDAFVSVLGFQCLGGVDNDGDGVCGALDCDDNDDSVYPTADQVCDGVNNDCDHSAWPLLWETNEFDDDGDGTTECAGDCNDGDATVFPGAPETLDGIDNQCPGDTGYGVVDEISGPTTFDSSEPPEFCWQAQAGATAYDVARALDPMFSSWCRVFTTTETCWYDSMRPLPGETAYYLVCPAAPMTGSWGQDSEGVERTVACPPNLVANGGLEVWSSPTDLASWVETTNGGTVNEESSPTDVFDGQRAARLTRTGSGAVNINAGIPLTPGQSYSLTFVAKSSLTLSAAAEIRIRNGTRGEDLQDDGTWSASTHFFVFDLDTTYARQSLQFAVDPAHDAGDAFRLFIRYSNSAPNGSELWIDDVAIQAQ